MEMLVRGGPDLEGWMKEAEAGPGFMLGRKAVLVPEATA
jgi:hypothetical protein